MEIGHRIKIFRENKNLSMNELAKKAGIGQSTLSYIESGQRQPTFEIVERIVNALGMTLAEFFTEDQEKTKLPTDILQIVNMAKEIPPEQLKVVEVLMETLIKESEKTKRKKKKKTSQSSAGGDKIDLSKIPMAAHIDGDDKVPLTPELEATIIDAIRESRQLKQERKKRKPDKN